MACTIDHLRVDHRVAVLRDFTDLAGVTIRAGESGVLRGLGLDYARMEIWIELERDGARDRLRFALRATEGPRNGRMKEFFEMGESVETAPAHEPPPSPVLRTPSPRRAGRGQGEGGPSRFMDPTRGNSSANNPTHEPVARLEGDAPSPPGDAAPRDRRPPAGFMAGEHGVGAESTPHGPPSPPAGNPQRPPGPLRAYVGKQAPNDTSLGEHRVACDCDPAFHRELLPARGELSVHACLRCGTVTCSRSIGDDGRFTGNAWQENLTVALSEPVHRWIACWPRVKVDYTAHSRWPMSADLVRYPTLYYPADLRCTELGELAEIETRLAREQSAQSVAARLRATQRVRSAPPANVPEALRGYVMLWEALQLRPRSDLAKLLHLAQPRSLGCDVAAELLRQRPDAFDLIVDSLRSGDPTRRGVGFVMARDLRPADPRLEGVLIELMNGFSFDPLPDVGQGIVSRGRFEMVLLLIAELGLATPEMRATLRTSMRKLARHDPFLVDCVRTVLRELDARA